MFHAVEALGVESLPPLSFALRLGKSAIVWNASQRSLFVGAVRGLEPTPIAGLMHRYAESQSLFAGCIGPCSNHIAMWTYCC